MASVYQGTRERDVTTQVTVNGAPLDMRTLFREQPTTAFDWGYAGQGAPAQLALAILADHLADTDGARRHYEQFMRRVIRHLPPSGWTLTGAEIDAALSAGA